MLSLVLAVSMPVTASPTFLEKRAGTVFVTAFHEGDCSGSSVNNGPINAGSCFNFASGGIYGAFLTNEFTSTCTVKFWEGKDCSGYV